MLDDQGSKTVEAHLAAWADVLSLILLGITILIAGGIDPRRRVYGRSPLRTTVLTVFLSINIIYSAGRFVAEGILVETGPREFLLLSVVYCLRWLWLYVTFSRSGTRSANAFKVAKALRKLKTIRLGKSTSPTRYERKELVIRKGARIAKGQPYWRGFEENVTYVEAKDTYKVDLIEKELHANVLDEIGTVDFKQKIETANPDHLYKVFYDLVMTVDIKNPQLQVDYQPFLAETPPIVPPTSTQPKKVQATDSSDLGNVARRVAADACYYIWHSRENLDLRATQHVQLINNCLDEAVRKYFESAGNV